MTSLTRWWRPAAIAGGVGFATFWLGSLLETELSPGWMFSLGWHALTIVLLSYAAVAVRIDHPDPGRATLGWVSVVLIVAGLVASMEFLMVGTLVFGLTIAGGSWRSRLSGGLLVVGAGAFLATRLVNGPFWGDGTPDPAFVATTAFGASLVALGMGWVTLGLTHATVRVRS